MSNTAKQMIVFLFLSVICVYMSTQLSHIFSKLLQVDVALSGMIGKVTSHLGDWGVILNRVLALIVIPILAGGVVAAVFWFVKHVSMPHTMLVVWVTWLVMLVTIYHPL
tara:strand:- start:29 stop:355 length:327 start_codon:yes stop_codon:yes gene_type:complete